VRAITRYLGTWQANDLAMLYDQLAPGWQLRSPLHALTPPTAPGAPSMPTRATAIAGYRQIVVCWDREPNPYITAWEVQRATGAGAFATIATATTNCYVDGELALSTAYNYRVRALLRDVTPGAWSDVATATTAADDTGMLTTYRTALDRLQERLINTTAGPIHAGLPFDVADYGATGDGVTDDTSAITSAILAANASGGGWVTFSRPGTYLASQITVYRHVILDGGTAGAVCLKQIAATNTDFIISENFASLTGTGKLQPTDSDVPSWFGLKDLQVDASGQTSGTPRAIAFYGNPQFLIGTVYVTGARGDNLYTESSNVGNSSTFDAQDGSVFDTVISTFPGGKGWLFRGPHNAQIRNYLCVTGTGTDWAWYSEDGANFSGATDYIGQLHMYGTVGSTNGHGAHIGAAAVIDTLVGDGTVIEIASGNVLVEQLISLVFQTFAPAVTVTADNVTIHHYYAQVLGGGGITVLDWSGARGYLGGGNIQDAVGAANTIGLDVSGWLGTFKDLYIGAFAGAGSIGARNSGGISTFSGTLENCTTGWVNTGAYMVRADWHVVTSAGQVAVGGSTPGFTDRIDVREVGVQNAGTDVRVVAAASVNMTSTAVQTVVFAHTCLYTPVTRNVLLSFATTRTDYAWDFPPQLSGISATQLTVTCKLRTASASGTGDIVADVRIGV